MNIFWISKYFLGAIRLNNVGFFIFNGDVLSILKWLAFYVVLPEVFALGIFKLLNNFGFGRHHIDRMLRLQHFINLLFNSKFRRHRRIAVAMFLLSLEFVLLK